MLGWSMYDTLITVFLLCLLWSLVDITLYMLSQPPRKTHLLLLSIGMAATAIICIRVTVELEQMSPLIASLQQNIQACPYGT